MNKSILLFIILFLFAFNGFGQAFHFNANMGYGTYSLKSLKNFQDDMISSTSVNDESVESFPNYIYYNFITDFAFNSTHYVGIGLSYYTTGGRNHVSDYSGEYSFDIIANAYAIDIHYKINLISYNKWKIFFQYKSGLLISKLTFSESITVNNSSSTKQAEYSGYSVISEPSMYMTYSIYKSVKLSLHVGLERCSSARLLNDKGLQSDSDVDFFDFMDNVAADWSGLRTSVGIVYSFGDRNKKNNN